MQKSSNTFNLGQQGVHFDPQMHADLDMSPHGLQAGRFAAESLFFLCVVHALCQPISGILMDSPSNSRCTHGGGYAAVMDTLQQSLGARHLRLHSQRNPHSIFFECRGEHCIGATAPQKAHR